MPKISQCEQHKMNSNKRANGFSTAEHRSKHSREDSEYDFSTGFAHLEPQLQKVPGGDNFNNHQQYLPNRDEPHSTEIHDSLDRNLLVASIMGDEQDFVVTSPENLEKLKQEQTMVEARLRGIQHKLVMESKLRGAAQSLQRLQDERPVNAVDAERYDRLIADLNEYQTRSSEIQISILKHTVRALKNSQLSTAEAQVNALTNKVDLKRKDVGDPKGSQNLDFDSRSFYDLPDDLDFITDISNNAVNGLAGLDLREELETTKKRLFGLNKRLQEVVSGSCQEAGRDGPQSLLEDPTDSSDDHSTPTSFQLDLLDKGLKEISKVQSGALNDLRATQSLIETRLDRMATQVQNALSIQGEEHGYPKSIPDKPAMKSTEDGLEFLEKSIKILSEDRQVIANSLKNNRVTSEREEKLEKTEVILAGLWDILKSNDDLSKSSGISVHKSGDEDFSLPAFSTKVQTLFNRVTQQAEQQSVLRRQIEQQRDLNAEAEKVKDARITELNMKITDLGASNSRQSALQAEINYFQSTLENLKTEKAEQLKVLSSAEKAKEETEALLEATNSKYKAAEAEREHFESQVVRLQTELTIARAELDASGATRSQQAAQVAAENAIQQQLKALMNQCDALRAETQSAKRERDEAMASVVSLEKMRTELKEALADLEELTKAGVEAERERESLERAMDALRDKCEELETLLAEEKISGLDVRSPRSGGATMAPNGESTSTVVLKSEFKRLMREARADGFKALKVSFLH